MKTVRLLAALALGMAAPAIAQPDAGEPYVLGTRYSLQSEIPAGERIITVRLPAEYEAEPERRFPVVYLLDGGPEQDFAHIAGIAQSREMNGSFAPFILVGVQSVNRRHELAPEVRPDAIAEYEQSLGATPGGAAAFREELAATIKPWVERHYRTGGRDAVIGESLAALFIVDTLLERPDLFDDWIAISPSLWWDDLRIARGAGARLAMMGTGDERLYLAVGNEGYRFTEGVERLVDALRTRAPQSLSWAYVPLADSETHATIFHPAALDAFRLLYGTPTREYRPSSELLGRPAAPRSAEEQALLDEPCDDGEHARHHSRGRGDGARDAVLPLPRLGPRSARAPRARLSPDRAGKVGRRASVHGHVKRSTRRSPRFARDDE